jgi:maltose O-acetyltransferase
VLATFPGGVLEVGDRTFINYGVDIAATKLVHIGSDCLIGTHVIILDNDFHGITDRERVPEARPVIIANNVWIGNRATILPGVTIGEGSVVGAGSVVTGDIPARSVAVGNPARVIKTF